MILLCLFCFSSVLSAEKAGVVKFILGEAKYKYNNNAAFKHIGLNDEIFMEGILKTELDSEVGIQWTDNTTANLKGNQTILVRKLYDQTHKTTAWSKLLQDRLMLFSLQTKQVASSVAGIRRDEVEVKAENELYWDMEKPVRLDEAVELYQQQEFIEAIKLFLEIIEQAPLQKEAETARGYLILCYDKTNDHANRDLQIQKLKDDFPDSTLLEKLDIKDK